MRTIIAGSRTITNINEVFRAIADSTYDITQIISGGAAGVDTLAIEYAQLWGIPCTVMNANWDLYGKSAGYIRNTQMAEHADALVAVWDGFSRGTEHMIKIAREKGLKVYVSLPRTLNF